MTTPNTSDATTGVTASLANPASNTDAAAGETYIAIEGLIGSDFNDTLIGDANSNDPSGRARADALNGGPALNPPIMQFDGRADREPCQSGESTRARRPAIRITGSRG